MKSVIILLFSIISLSSLAQQPVIYFNDGLNNIYEITPATCQVQLVCTASDPNAFLDIAINPLDHMLYGVNGSGFLCRVDLSNGNTTTLFNTGVFNSLTFDQSGILYAAGPGSGIYTINLNTGVVALVGNLASGNSFAGDISFFNNVLYCSSGVHVLDYIDLNNPSNSYTLGDMGIYDVFGLSTILNGCTNELYAFSGANMYRLNLDNDVSAVLQCPLPANVYVMGSASASERIVKSVYLGQDKYLCQSGDSVLLDATTPGATYLWQDNSTDAVLYAHQPGKYWVTVTTSDCISSDTIFVLPYIRPHFNLGADLKFCALDYTYRHIPSVSNLNALYSWKYIDESNHTTITAGQDMYMDWSTPGSYIGMITSMNCLVTDTIEVSQDEVYLLSLDPDTLICHDTPVRLEAPVLPGFNFHYEWSDHSTNSYLNVSQSGRYGLTISDLHCSAYSETLVRFRHLPVLDFGPDTGLCVGETLQLNVPTGYHYFKWQDDPSLNTPTLTVTQPGTYWVETDIIVTYGSCMSRDTINVTFSSPADATLNQSPFYCDHQLLSPADAAMPGVTFLWQDHSTAPTNTVNGTGKYWVRLNNQGCMSSDTLLISAFETLELGNDSTICGSQTISLNALKTGASYLWSDGSTDPGLMVTQGGEYWVTVTTSDCVLRDTVEVNYYADCEPEIIMPNLITLNGDRQNDVFKPIRITDGIVSVKYEIVNNWGQQVFASDRLPIEWDAKEVSEGIYYWRVEYVDYRGNAGSKKGWVQILK